MSIGTWCEGCGPHESLGTCSECGYAIEAGWVITDEMVERAARAEHAHSGHRMPSGELSNWDMLTPFQRDQYRRRARRVLTAALSPEARDA